MRRFKKYGLLQARKDLPRRNKKDHKSHGGKALIIAGSKNMWGAGILAARACARSGAGYVYLKAAAKFPFAHHPDFLFYDSGQPLTSFSAIALGPGYRKASEIKKMLEKLRKNPSLPVVLDAEAINFLAKSKKSIKLPSHWVVTPHEGELGRLLKITANKVRTDRKKFAIQAQKKFGCVVLLKGFHTLIVDENYICEIQSGNVALAKAGTGDVLTGIITGLMSQGLSSYRAACLGSYIHGSMADHWVRSKKDVLSLMASDLLADLPKALYRIR